ncbi:MAG: MoxR family ATPase [Planctomycetota bacterium]
MQSLRRLRANIQSCFYGNAQAVDRALVCLLAGGHLLIEDVPGVGKTTLALSLSKSIDGSLSRVQMTPDLLPADILGLSVWDQQQGRFEFKPGPIFHNVVLADEINRTTPRTQSALLEAMSERQVSLDGQTRRLLEPFMVIATQNPFEFEGTYFLPESQLDRFLIRVRLGYPSPEDEARVLTDDPQRHTMASLKPVLTCEELVGLQRKVGEVEVDRTLVDYVVSIANATRRHDQLQIGVSPRGSLALVRTARATAMLDGRDYAVPEDVIGNVLPVFAHRCVTRSYTHEADGMTAEQVLQQVLETLPSPV